MDARGLFCACGLLFWDAIENFHGESMILIGIEFPNADFGMARRLLVNFCVGSALVAGCRGGVVLVLFRFGEDAVFSMFYEAVNDHPSIDEASVSVPFLSAFLSVMPLACLELGFPPVLFPVFGFAFRFFSASASFWFVVLSGQLHWQSCFLIRSRFRIEVHLVARCLRNVGMALFS